MAFQEGNSDRKRARVTMDGGNNQDPSKFQCDESIVKYLQRRLQVDYSFPSSLLPGTVVGNDVDRFQILLQNHGFRTAKVSSPRAGVSVYTDREDDPSAAPSDDGRRFLAVALGLDPQQAELEHAYQESFRRKWCMLLFCAKLRQTYFCDVKARSDVEIGDNRTKFQAELEHVESACQQVGGQKLGKYLVATLISLAVKAKSYMGRFHRAEEWEREYQRIVAWNSTLANVHLSVLQDRHGMNISDVIFKPGTSKYERTTIFLYDPNVDSRKPPPFVQLPCAYTLMKMGVYELASLMVECFFDNLLCLGHFVTSSIKDGLEQHLHRFFSHGIQSGQHSISSTAPLSLGARFDPTSPFAVFLHGPPGLGKSSLARYLPLALEQTIVEYADPEYTVRFVKQNLNKPMATLELELEIRPNNNDLSLMSIIQSRKQNMSQFKEGMVVLNLEEMPNDSRCDQDPDQVHVSKLITRRFGGRKVDIHEAIQQNGEQIPRNASRFGIGDDFSLATIFTSNYPLCSESRNTLRELALFRDLAELEVCPIMGHDRTQFALSFFVKCCDELGAKQVKNAHAEGKVELNIDVGVGDTRPLVQTLRILAFYLSKLMGGNKTNIGEPKEVVDINVTQKEQECSITVISEDKSSIQQIVLCRPSVSCCTWFPLDNISKCSSPLTEILNLWKCRALTPAVILSSSIERAQQFMVSLEQVEQCHCIRSVNAAAYKMSKSLYDRKETPNLRDDILKFGQEALVAIELLCPTLASQLLIREMIEDSPSMTAFSSAQSALFKAGLLFVLCVEGDLSPEVASRVSFTLGENEKLPVL